MTDAANPVIFAGFWRRFGAYLIDKILISVVEFVVFVPVLAMVGIGVFTSALEADADSIPGFIFLFVGAILFLAAISTVLNWLYFALMESSARGATIGKMAVGIHVTDVHGGRISFGRATGRYFAKIISGMILMIGYIMAAFMDRKQALHDLMAGTVVILD